MGVWRLSHKPGREEAARRSVSPSRARTPTVLNLDLSCQNRMEGLTLVRKKA